jgi:hypothetical protein
LNVIISVALITDGALDGKKHQVESNMPAGVQMREALSSAMQALRRVGGLPDGYMTPDRPGTTKSKEEQEAERAALESHLNSKLQSQVKLPEGMAPCLDTMYYLPARVNKHCQKLVHQAT